LARKLRMLTPHKWSGNPGGTAVSNHILTALGINDNPRHMRPYIHAAVLWQMLAGFAVAT